MIDVIYSPDYLNWQLGRDHPTNPVRALNAVRLIEAMQLKHELLTPRLATREELELVHAPGYVSLTLEGVNEEWRGIQPVLGETAQLMAGGTMLAVDRMLAGDSVRAFNPQGAKHHAHRGYGSGFCVFNDMAMAARRFILERGWKTLYVDWDVHHGDGVEALLLEEEMAMTASIHGKGFPGTGTGHLPDKHAYNWMLENGADGRDALAALAEALHTAEDFQPDVVLLAAGADAHITDPLGPLRLTVEDYADLGRALREFADDNCEGRVLIGGAGGYQPHTWTPQVWATVVREME